MSKNLGRLILAFLFLLSVLPGITTAGAWYCEGKQCGVTPQICCCDDSDEKRDQNCPEQQEAKVRRDVATTSACQSECGCTLIISADREDFVPVVVASVHPPLLALFTPPYSVSQFPLFGELLPAPVVARGPPSLRFAHLSRIAPRAPPIA